jgi:hypothetical protein
MKIGNSQCNQQNEGGQAKRAEQKNDGNQEQSGTKQKPEEFGFA